MSNLSKIEAFGVNAFLSSTSSDFTSELEDERIGRDKSVVINSSYINGGEFRRKFDYITDNKDLNKLMYQNAKEILKCRSVPL